MFGQLKNPKQCQDIPAHSRNFLRFQQRSTCQRSPAENSGKVVDSKHSSKHAPRASVPRAQNSERVFDSKQNSQDAPRASAATRRRQREGRRFQTEFSGRSMRQRCLPPKTARGPSIPNRILRTLHANALPRTQNSERVVDSEQNSQDAPCASAATRRKQREGRRLQKNPQDVPRASAATRPKQREGHRVVRSRSGVAGPAPDHSRPLPTIPDHSRRSWPFYKDP